MHNTSNGSLIIRRLIEPPDYMFEWSCQRRPLRRGKKKEKKRDGCFTCGLEEHWANKCTNKYKKPGQDSKSLSVTLSNNDGASGYGNLFTVLSDC